MKSILQILFPKFLLLIFFSMGFSSLQARDWWRMLPDNYGNETHFGIIVRNDFLPNNTFKTYGLRIQYPLNEHWNLDYDYHFINAGNGLHFSHMPAATMGVKYLLMYAPGGDGLLYSMILLMIVPEGVSYKINPGKKIQYVPYLHPLGVDRLVFTREGQAIKKPWGMTCNTGVEIQSNLPGKFYAAADAGITYNYASGKTAFGAGISIGIRR
jgi:hypothetical protein